MLAVALLLSVRAEPVEGRPPLQNARRSSTSSGRTAIDAERAFAADALTIGRWAAFRKWATDDAIMFFPEPALVQVRLKDAGDPPATLRWSPTASYVSCNGKATANTGEWRSSDGSTGYFSTIWVRRGGRWRWSVEHGDRLAEPRRPVAVPALRRAACAGRRPAIVTPPPLPGVRKRFATSGDTTLLWQWTVQPGGAHSLVVSLWNGAGYDVVIDDRIVPPPPPPVR